MMMVSGATRVLVLDTNMSLVCISEITRKTNHQKPNTFVVIVSICIVWNAADRVDQWPLRAAYRSCHWPTEVSCKQDGAQRLA